MNKICTSIEQSQKLIELGIDIKTADMYWWATSLRYYMEAMNDGDFNEAEGHIPAWSLTALIDILPDTITDEVGTFFGLNIQKRYVEYYNPSMGALYATYHSIIAEDLVDAAFEMIIWLKENKYI